METLSPLIIPSFVVITLMTVFLFWKASNRSNLVLIVALAWLALQGIIAGTGFYLVTDTVPPRFALLIGPPLVFIAILFSTVRGRKFIDSLDVKTLTLIHAIRIPVELILFSLFISKLIPVHMTFEGNNPDILSGITALIVYYFGFIRKKFSNTVLIIWNVVCLALLVNIVAIAILTAPLSFQRMAFDQPNIGVMYFPFIWLPCLIVPVVLLSHLASLRQLLMKSPKVKLAV